MEPIFYDEENETKLRFLRTDEKERQLYYKKINIWGF